MMMVFIVLASTLVGLETYPGIVASSIYSQLDNVVLAFFIFELVIKVIGEGSKPQLYFIGPQWRWNWFDLIVIIFCIPAVSKILGSASPIARIFRLGRIIEVVEQISSLHAVVRGLIGGMQSIGYIAILLLLVFYLYGVVGVIVFKSNNPFYFGSIPRAFMSLLRGVTLESWDSMMFIDIWGCDNYNGGIYDLNGKNSTMGLYDCVTPTRSPITAVVYWVTFLIIASLIVLSLFIGVITLSMQDAINEVHAEDIEVCLGFVVVVIYGLL
jgi:voltage-gated sodium channel